MEAELYTLIAVALAGACRTLASDIPVSAIVGVMYELSDNTNAQFIRPFDWGVHTFTEKNAFVKPPQAREKCDFPVSSARLLSNTA
ncbi:hypothetical protein ACIP1T_01185 [Pseudomonas japonica]|uniref:hypothetical protein n=1 Tax=Pseudomonas TaxID=286 RepID=UPI0029275E60|nr:hypothetical protein [Pseudomonas sp. zfem002]MDU9390323.1 hypothetical protein [Pseudomonas sp. zfem002]